MRFTHDGRGALIVLAEAAGDLTFWPTAERQTVVLKSGYLDHTAGLETNLLDTNVINTTDAPLFSTSSAEYFLDRTWENNNGTVKTDRATARMNCADDLQAVTLPLITLDLGYCVETLVWSNGETTRSEFWVAKDTGRIWRANTRPWPGSGSFQWQVARPWW